MLLLQTELLSSLVLSMLQQILNDDKADGVRQAAAKSLAVLVAFIDDKAKFQNVTIVLYNCQTCVMLCHIDSVFVHISVILHNLVFVMLFVLITPLPWCLLCHSVVLGDVTEGSK